MRSLGLVLSLVYFLFCKASSPSLVGYGCSLEGILASISEQDRSDLAHLFRSLVRNHQFGYTLFGEKPVSLASYFDVVPWENIVFRPAREPLQELWNTWRRYVPLLPSNQFILKESRGAGHQHTREIVLINRAAFRKVVNQHLELFQDILGPDITPDGLLVSVEEGKSLTLDVLEENETLIGIVLGYGKRNARLFCRRQAIEEMSHVLPPKLVELQPSEGFSSWQDEYDALNAHLKAFGARGGELFIVDSVRMVADLEHPETVALKERYSRTQSELCDVYAELDEVDPKRWTTLWRV